MPPKRHAILTTLYFPEVRPWADATDMVDLDTAGPLGPLSVARSAMKYDAIVVDGGAGIWAGRRDHLIAAVLARRRDPPAVVITDATWKLPASPPARLARRAGLHAIDGEHVTYCVLSSEERQLFPRTWGVDPARVAFTPYTWTWPDDELALAAPGDGSVFAGGDSMRDYRPLLDAAGAIPAPITIAASRSLAGRLPDLPPNLAVGPVEHPEFVRRTASASVIVVPLRAEGTRSAGQQTYLNAMAMGKPVIATDAPGVRDYITHGVTGLIVPPSDPRALREAVCWVLDPANAAGVRELGARARETVLSGFRTEDYASALLAVIENAIARTRRTRQASG
jgi:Glycosyl transferases group 1